MIYYIADDRTYVGDHEYLERGVLSACSYETAEKRAIKDRKFFYPLWMGGILPI